MTVPPAVLPLKRPRLPTVAERMLPSGVQVLAVRRASVPRVEARLRVPMNTGSTGSGGARERLMAGTLLAGTSTRSSIEIAELLQSLGAGLGASAGQEELMLGGSVLASGLRPFLDLVGDVLADAAFPDDEVEVQQQRLVQELGMLRSQPGVQAWQALARQLYGRHQYGSGLPSPEAVERITPLALQRFRKRRLLPDGSVLVLVGDLRPQRALDEAEDALAAWDAPGSTRDLPVPEPTAPGPTLLVDRPGAVQTNIRMGGLVAGRANPDYAALRVANTIFGGYFSSRLTENIRERKGYAYTPSSGIDHHQQASELTVSVDVATAVTVPALLEVRYEMARMAADDVSPRELEDARRYLAGGLALGMQTQSGLASQLLVLSVDGFGIEFLRDHLKELEAVTVDDVRDVAMRYLAPKGLATVLVGDAALIERQVRTLDELEVIPAA